MINLINGYLGDTHIEETNEYLGVYFSRSLKPTQHIGNHIKDNIDNKLNGMIIILSKHGNVNEFGSALWNSVLRPRAAHGCSIWFPSSAAQKDL